MSATTIATEAVNNGGSKPSVQKLLERTSTVASAAASHCLVCYSDLDSLLRGKTPCDHNDICGICHLRLRHLHKDKKCPICKTQNDTIIVDRSADASSDEEGNGVPEWYREYPMWGDDIGPDYVFRDGVGMFFPRSYYETEILPLFGYQCHQCDFDPSLPQPVDDEPREGDGNGNSNKKKNGRVNNKKKAKTLLGQLKDHLRTKHGKQMCNLCITHQRDFVSKLPRMTPRALQEHMKKGDGPESGFTGHPLCEFCRPTRFYSLQELHTHLQKDHYRCHVCDSQGKPDQYFKHYKSLEKHFDRQHFLCRDVQCLAARFVVFSNELDLRAHEMSVHGGTSTGSNKLQLEFRTRRTAAPGGLQSADQQQELPSDADFDYTVDGQAFVPEALPSTRGNQTMLDNQDDLHPMHVQRTAELREHAARIREAGASSTESFPSLSGGNRANDNNAASSNNGNNNTAAARLRVGWADGTAVQRLQANRAPAGRVTDEDFPTLGPSTAPNGPRGVVGLVSRGSAQHRQFDAMTRAASQSASSAPTFNGLSYGSAAATAPSAETRVAPNMFASASARPALSANRQQDLGPSNFPALGGGAPASARVGGSNTYAAANAYAKRLSQQRASSSHSTSASSDMFPSLGKTRSNKAKATTATPPAIDSVSSFPAMAQAGPSIAQMARDRVMNQSEISSQQESNVLQVPVIGPQAAKATIADMKASLGPSKFKQLKKLTKEFAESNLSAEGYVDQSAALFNSGYSDRDFWAFLPTLLESCPNEEASMQALSYMTSLKRQLTQQSVKRAPKKSANPTPSWSSGGPTIRPSPVATSNGGSGWGANGANRASSGVPVARVQPMQQLTSAQFQTRAAAIPSQKKKGAWGGKNGTATVARARASPGAGALSVAAATQGPQGGSATKFMATQQKQQQQQPKQNGKKKKKNNELRALAFGK